MQIRIAATNEEIIQIARFNAEIHGSELYNYILELYAYHPLSSNAYWLYIKNTSTTAILASLALLPNYWEIGNTQFRIAEMGFVGTLPDYRGRGLFGILNEIFEQLAAQENYMIAALRGIPYFYSKYGYCFALPTDAGHTISVDSFKVSEQNIVIRRATPTDKSAILRLYSDTFSDYYITTSPTIFTFSNTPANHFYVIESEQVLVYFQLEPIFDPTTVVINQLSYVSANQMNAILMYLHTAFPEAQHITVRDMPWIEQYFSTAEHLDGWQWQIKIINVQLFLQSLCTVFEKRIASSSFKGLTDEISISEYHTTFVLSFSKGKITDIGSHVEFPSRTVDLRIPPYLLPKLLLADKTIVELNHVHPDVLVNPTKADLLNSLFPKLTSFPIGVY